MNFYKRFIKNFNVKSASLTDCMKGKVFTWTRAAAVSFEQLRKKVTEAPILAIPDFEKLFTVECDASRIAIGGSIKPRKQTCGFFGEKLNEAKRIYTTYDK